MQTTEFTMFSPHERAKIFRRYTVENIAETSDENIIKYQNNYYKSYSKIRWIEDASKTRTESQFLPGLIIDGEFMTIKTNSLEQILPGDLLSLENELWIVESDIQIAYGYFPKKVQTFQYLPLRKVK